jgi:deoxycytidine triphosphate deaminase
VLLSDRDLKAELASGGLGLSPYDEALVQPSSIDVRLDRYFRVFANHRYSHIDPSQPQDDLTEMVEPVGEEPFVLHPGEFVLGSTLEVVTLGDHLASRLEGKALALCTEVPTPRGWTTMEHLRVGDEVFDETGAPTRVVAATGVLQRRPCYAVELSDGSRLLADAAHQWFTRTKAERSRGLPGRSRTTQELACTLRAGREWNHHIPLAAPVRYPPAELDVVPHEIGRRLVDAADDAEVWSQAARALTGSVEQRRGVLRGVLSVGVDVDRFGRCTLVSDSERVADLLVELTASLGLRPAARKRWTTRRGVETPAHEVRVTVTDDVLQRRSETRERRRAVVGRTAALRREAVHRPPRFRAVVAVRPTASVPVRCIEVAAESGVFLVGRTYVPTHNSSLGRLGLLTHSTAGFIDPGFSGHVTLELSNVANLPIKLFPGMKIGQVCVFRLTSPAEHPYGADVHGSRYQGQRGPTPSRSHLRFSRARTLPEP